LQELDLIELDLLYPDEYSNQNDNCDPDAAFQGGWAQHGTTDIKHYNEKKG